MYKSGFTSRTKIPLEYDTDTVHLGKDGKTRYRDCLLDASWRQVTQRVREDNIVDDKGERVFKDKEAAVAAE